MIHTVLPIKLNKPHPNLNITFRLVLSGLVGICTIFLVPDLGTEIKP